jgi:hypothetical protein
MRRAISVSARCKCAPSHERATRLRTWGNASAEKCMWPRTRTRQIARTTHASHACSTLVPDVRTACTGRAR